MNRIEATHTAPDGKEIFTYWWEPNAKPLRGAVQIAHGLAEHAGRYERLASALAARGFATLAHDHRGHGQTDPEARGHIPGGDGFARMAGDLGSLCREARARAGGGPVFLLGHSMGVALALRAVAEGAARPDGIALSGPPAGPRPALAAMAAAARASGRLFGEGGAGPGLDLLWSGPARLRFWPRRTDFDWLSRDPDEVDRYVADPACGFVCSRAFYRDMFRGIDRAYRVDAERAAELGAPVYIFGGADDPVGFAGRAAKALERRLRGAGAGDVSLKLYDGGRHEMLNDSERDRVVSELAAWIEDRAAAPSRGAPAAEGARATRGDAPA